MYFDKQIQNIRRMRSDNKILLERLMREKIESAKKNYVDSKKQVSLTHKSCRKQNEAIQQKLFLLWSTVAIIAVVNLSAEFYIPVLAPCTVCLCIILPAIFHCTVSLYTFSDEILRDVGFDIFREIDIMHKKKYVLLMLFSCVCACIPISVKSLSLCLT